MPQLFGSIVLATTLPLSCIAQLTTSQYDNSRTGANLHETILTPRNVNSRQFGRLFSLRVDGDEYAQPLYLSGLQIPGKGKRDILFVATEHDSIYAFDAQGESRTPLWHVNFLNAGQGITTVEVRDVRCPFVNPEIGITATPVIDPASGTLYVLARTRSGNKTSGFHFFHHLHAIDITTGAERSGSPVEIHAPAFDPLLENPRAALLLAAGNVYLTWGSSCDAGDYHGWVMAYDARSLEQEAALNTSPKDKESGIWASDTGPPADQAGNIFIATGNGKFDAPQGPDYGDTLLRLRLDQGVLKIDDYFTPCDQAELNKADNDLGSGGPLLLPDQPGPHPHLVLIGGKGGTLYAIDRDHLGRLRDTSAPPVEAVRLGGSLLAAPAYWNRHIYVFANRDVLKAFKLHDGHLELTAKAPGGPFDPGATPTISANGDKDGIVWTLSSRNWEIISEKLATLHAFDATDVSKELYNSDQLSDRDRGGISIRFAIPTVVNGRVYVGARNEVDVYGLLSSITK